MIFKSAIECIWLNEFIGYAPKIEGKMHGGSSFERMFGLIF